MYSRCETKCGGFAFTAAKIIKGRMTSPETGVGVEGGGGDIVKRGEGVRRGTFKVDDPSADSSLDSMAGLSVSGFGNGSVDSGESTIVAGVGDSRSLVSGFEDSSSASSCEVRLPNVPARGVLSSKVNSSGFNLIGGSLDNPSEKHLANYILMIGRHTYQRGSCVKILKPPPSLQEIYKSNLAE